MSKSRLVRLVVKAELALYFLYKPIPSQSKLDYERNISFADFDKV